MNNLINEITPTRNFNITYIIIDSIFLIILLILLLIRKKNQTVLFGLFGGILYLIVDYVGFYLLSHSRTIYFNNELCNSLNTFLVLLWMSLSYGFTNFVYIWLLLRNDKDTKYFIFLIIAWWIVAPSISTLGDQNVITTMRTTNSYHGLMGLALFVSYFILILVTFIKKKEVANIIKLNLIGISVQFAWEFALLINGIRPFNETSIKTLIVNSLIETNLGMPAIYLIYCLVNKKFNEDMSKKEKIDEERKA